MAQFLILSNSRKNANVDDTKHHTYICTSQHPLLQQSCHLYFSHSSHGHTLNTVTSMTLPGVCSSMVTLSIFHAFQYANAENTLSFDIWIPTPSLPLILLSNNLQYILICYNYLLQKYSILLPLSLCYETTLMTKWQLMTASVFRQFYMVK